MSLPFEYTQRQRPIQALDIEAQRVAALEQHDRELEDFLRALSARVDAQAAGPIGTVIDYAGSGTPDNFLLCDGSTFSIATYPDLATVLGTTWGTPGPGLCTLPNLSNRSTIGASGTHALGSTGGVAATELLQHTHTATFTGAALATHNHTFTGSALGTHNHTFTGSAVTSGGQSVSHTHSVDPPATGAGAWGTQGNPAGWVVGAVGVIFGPSGANSGSPLNWFQQPISIDIAAFNSGTASVGHTHSVTAAGNNTAVSAGTPAGTNTAVSAGTPAGTIAVANTGDATPDNYHPFAAVRKLIRAA